MGVPAFYRWLSEKYPKIVVEMQEDRTVHVEGTEIPLDLTAENPCGIEVCIVYKQLLYRKPQPCSNQGGQKCARHAHVTRPMEENTVPLVREAGASALCARLRAPQALQPLVDRTNDAQVQSILLILGALLLTASSLL